MVFKALGQMKSFAVRVERERSGMRAVFWDRSYLESGDMRKSQQIKVKRGDQKLSECGVLEAK